MHSTRPVDLAHFKRKAVLEKDVDANPNIS